jgi:hypothetical protein
MDGSCRISPQRGKAARTLDLYSAQQMLYKMKERRIPVAEARKNLAAILADAAKKNTRVKVTRYNKTLVGIISRHDLAQLKDCEERMPRLRKRRRRRNMKRGENPRSR